MSAESISVIIPTHRNRGFLPATLESVFAQTRLPDEVIVVDDGSTDDTPDRLRELSRRWPVRVVRQPNAGVAGARNTGIAAAAGVWIALLDDDDLWPPDKLEWQAAFLRSHPDIGVVAGLAAFLHHARGLEEPLPAQLGRLSMEDLLLQNRMFSPGQALLRRTVFDQVGLFDARLAGADDLDLWLRCVGGPGLWMEGRVALHYRMHATAASTDALMMLDRCYRTASRHTRLLPPARGRELLAGHLQSLFEFHGRIAVRDLKRRLRKNPASTESRMAVACILRYAFGCRRRSAFFRKLFQELLPDRFKQGTI